MQEDLNPDTPKMSHKGLSTPSLICLIVSFIILICSAFIVYACIFSNIETRTGRMAGLTFPVETDSFTIQSIETGWKSTEGDERLSLRASHCPYVTLTLEDIKAAGTLFLTFADSQAKPVGDMLALHFTIDGFSPSNDSRVKIDGFNVAILHDRGFVAKDDYYLLTIDEMQSFWRLGIDYKILDDNKKIKLGYTSISSEYLD